VRNGISAANTKKRTDGKKSRETGGTLPTGKSNWRGKKRCTARIRGAETHSIGTRDITSETVCHSIQSYRQKIGPRARLNERNKAATAQRNEGEDKK